MVPIFTGYGSISVRYFECLQRNLFQLVTTRIGASQYSRIRILRIRAGRHTIIDHVRVTRVHHQKSVGQDRIRDILANIRRRIRQH